MLSNKDTILGIADVNGDGLDDIYIGGSAGTPGQLLIQSSGAKFSKKKVADFINDALHEDAGCTFIVWTE